MASKKPTESRVSEAKASGESGGIAALVGHMKAGVVPEAELHANLPLFLRRQELSRILFLDHIYRQILDVSGYILEFGVRYGANLALYTSLRGMYEPYNYSRKIIGFDTFEGFAGASDADKELGGGAWKEGDYAVPLGHEAILTEMLRIHEGFSPLGHIEKFQLRKGDVRETLPKFLTDHPETVVALAYFDMDIYAPTKEALRLIKPRLHKGSVIVFDEFCCDYFPGETQAVLEELDLRSLRLKRHPHQPFCAWAVVE